MPDDLDFALEEVTPPPLLRRFTIRDGVILIAAAAVGWFGSRSAHLSVAQAKTDLLQVNMPAFSEWTALAGSTLVALTAGLVITRLLAPRPPRQELFRQPGFVAAVVALMLGTEAFAETWILLSREPMGVGVTVVWNEAILRADFGILVAWAVLALAGSLKKENSWVDKSLRIVAVIWLVAGIGSRVVLILASFTPRGPGTIAN